jgi:hypothetical protein
MGAAFFGVGGDIRGRKNFRVRGKRLDMLVDIGAERLDPGLGVDDRCGLVGGGDGAAERIGEVVVDLVGQMIEGAVLVEAYHVDRPFDRCAVAADRQPSIVRARDGDDATIKFWRQPPVDLDLHFTGAFALFQSGKIEKRKAHRALDLQRAVAGEKHGGCVRIDAPDFFGPAAIDSRIGEKRQHVVLRKRCVAHAAKPC